MCSYKQSFHKVRSSDKRERDYNMDWLFVWEKKWLVHVCIELRNPVSVQMTIFYLKYLYRFNISREKCLT